MLLDRDPAALLKRSNPFVIFFAEIKETAQAKLRRSCCFELRDVSCDFCGGILTLRGRVPSYHRKQPAQAKVAEVASIHEIHNRVEVVTPRSTGGSNPRERQAPAYTCGESR